MMGREKIANIVDNFFEKTGYDIIFGLEKETLRLTMEEVCKSNKSKSINLKEFNVGYGVDINKGLKKDFQDHCRIGHNVGELIFYMLFNKNKKYLDEKKYIKGILLLKLIITRNGGSYLRGFFQIEKNIKVDYSLVITKNKVTKEKGADFVRIPNTENAKIIFLKR